MDSSEDPRQGISKRMMLPCDMAGACPFGDKPPGYECCAAMPLLSPSGVSVNACTLVLTARLILKNSLGTGLVLPPFGSLLKGGNN